MVISERDKIYQENSIKAMLYHRRSLIKDLGSQMGYLFKTWSNLMSNEILH